MGKDTNTSARKKYRYSAFGLQIDSEFMLAELPEGRGGAADVRIICGDVPNKLDSPREKQAFFQGAESEFLFWVDGVAGYYITKGEQIIMQPYSQADLRESRMYLLGTAMGILLLQRGIVPIHGSTVSFGGRGVVFTGMSGAGKSTMAAALHKKGYSVLADDISAVTFDNNGVPWIQPEYPYQKLWQVSASMLGVDTNILDRLCNGEDKYAVRISKGFGKLPIPFVAVYEIDVQPCDDVTILPLKGIEKLTTILDNTCYAGMVNGLGLKTPHFHKCANLSKNIHVFRLTRPENMMSLDRQLEVLVQHCKELDATSSYWTGIRSRKVGGAD